MKFVEPRPFEDAAAAAAQILDIANGIGPDRDGRISVGVINKEFMALGGSAPEYSAGLKLAISGGYLDLHRSGAFVTFTQKGADKFA